VRAIEDATAFMLDRAGQPDALAGAGAYLAALGDTAGGWMLAKGALAAAKRIAEGQGDRAWLEGKLDLLDLYAGQVLALTPGKAAAAMQGAEAVKALAADAFGG
jgi:hypothetical protein